VEPLQSLLVEALDLLAHAGGRSLQEMLRQERDVLRPFPQAGDPDRDDGQAIVEILPELPLPHEGRKVSIGGAD
jgi:hypothetical protein